MTSTSQHAEWLSLIDVSGPFLAEPVLKSAFPQGLEGVAPEKRKKLRQAYEEWHEARDQEDADFPQLHAAWIDLVLREGLELDEDRQGQIFKAQSELPEALAHTLPEHGVTLRPDFAVVDDQSDDKPLLLVSVFDPDVSLITPIKGDGWVASPAERMVELCRGIGVRLGLLTNGEQWMFIDAPVGGVTTFATWEASLWHQEPKTLQAFVNLLGVRRFFVDSSEQLPALLDESLKHQDEVTDALGEQVRRAVEVLIQSLDRANVDRNHELLEGVEPAELYEAALTVMMRIVFLLSAEERGLLLMGDERYEANYALSTLRIQLRGESEEILERRWDAWSRLLAIFRAIYGGIEHESMRLPALGGSLFDPDRFPFLEGRSQGSRWKTDNAKPLPIDNRTVLLLLDAVQLFQGRTLSYRALDVEQIGYVYEGLLERTVIRAREVTLDLDATKSAKKPWVTLDELDAAAATGDDAVSALLKERTGSSASRVTNDLAKQAVEAEAEKLLTACHGDQSLRDRIKPYFHFLRIDPWGYPLVYPVDTFIVTTGADRRETGTHYTPKSLTEAIVKETLEPVVYVGPAEGKPREDWQLKSPAKLLDLKICDPAMGSGAFLVQACRWLSERLVEAWVKSEAAGNTITSEGLVVDKANSHEPLRGDPEERLLTARRLTAERCLYGVDINPLAVELAKLSIWLITLAKGRPFGFLDHNLRSGDSLLGIHELDQLLYVDMFPGKGSSKKLFAARIDEAVTEAIDLRARLRSRPIRDIRDVDVMEGLDKQARAKLQLPELIADALVGEALAANGKKFDTTSLSIEAGRVADGDGESMEVLRRRATKGLSSNQPDHRLARRPLHWPLEFPEVFAREAGGFDAMLGNPPFMGGRKISSNLGENYSACIKNLFLPGKKGSINLVLYFLLRGARSVRSSGAIGFIATDSVTESDTRSVGMTSLFEIASPFRAVSSQPWPGKAGVYISVLHMYKGEWTGEVVLNGKKVHAISTMLRSGHELPQPQPLVSNSGFCSDGVKVQGIGFVLHETEAQSTIKSHPDSVEILSRYIVGDDINNHPTQLSDRWVINFWNRPQHECEKYSALWDILVERVKPYRDGLTKQVHEKCFWKFWDRREDFFNKVRAKKSVFVCSKLSKYLCLAEGDPNHIYSEKVKVFDFSSHSPFAVLQSVFHEEWALAWGSTTGETPAYVGSTCFDTFPFPDFMISSGGQLKSDACSPDLEKVGKELCDHRSTILVERGIGLTAAYNLFHNQEIYSDDIEKLRSLHYDMNCAVASCYGWSDLDLSMEFRAIGHLPEGRNTRYTVKDSTVSEIIKRLSQLNRKRSREKVDSEMVASCASSTLHESKESNLFTSVGRRGN